MQPPDHFRATARKKLELPILLRQQRRPWEREGRAVDMGLAGACVESPDSLEPGTDVVLEIRTPTLWDPLMLTGNVAWCHRASPASPFRIGIRFAHRSSSALLGLFELLGAHGFDL